MRTAVELQDELEAQVVQRVTSVKALEAERGKLLLAAVSGDGKAMRRTAVVKREISDHVAALADLNRALGDLEPLVARERLDAHHAHRLALAAQVHGTLDRVIPVIARIDAAIADLKAAAAEAAPLMEAARFLISDLTVRDSGNVTEIALARMLVLAGTVFQTLPALIEGRLAYAQLIPNDGIPLVRCPLVEMVEEARRIAEIRIADALSRDKREAAALAEQLLEEPELAGVA